MNENPTNVLFRKHETPITDRIKKLFNSQLQQLVESKIYNRGLDTYRQFEFRSHIYKSEPIQVPDRRKFIQDSIKNNINNFAFIDVVNLRQADMAIDDLRGDRAADLLLNQLSHIVISYLKKYNTENSGKKIDFCRYGGDEFVFSYSGLDSNEINQANFEIKQLLNKMYGFYRPKLDQKTIEKRNIDINFELIEQNQSDFSKEIFAFFIKRGAILKNEDIEKLKKRFKVLDSFKKWEQLQEKEGSSFYPQNYQDTESKLDYLLQVNPVLKEKINQLIKWSDIIGEEAKKNLLENLELIFVDPLLRNPFISKSDIIDNVLAGNISHIWTFDLKFLKEINKISYADGDGAIEMLWNTVKKSISSDDFNKLIIAKEGPTFIIGLKQGEKISAASQAQLGEIQYLSFKSLYGKELTVSLGKYEHEINREFIEKKYGLKEALTDDEKIRVSTLMKEESQLIFDTPDKLFYNELAKYFLTQNYILNGGIVKLYWDVIFSKDKINDLSSVSLIYDYFISKRAAQRLSGLERALNDIKENKEEAYIEGRLRNIRKKVRLAMTYAYAHDMTSPEDIKELEKILL